MLRFVLTAVLALSTLVPGALCASQDTPSKASESDVNKFDDDDAVAPWERSDAIAPDAGVDDDPTPFNPGETPDPPEQDDNSPD
jgi:hypothetical protein